MRFISTNSVERGKKIESISTIIRQHRQLQLLVVENFFLVHAANYCSNASFIHFSTD